MGKNQKVSDRWIAGKKFLQSECIFDSEAIGIVIKIDKYSFAFPSPILDLFSPLFQFFIWIIRAIENFTSVKTKVGEVRSQNLLKRESWTMGDTEGEVKLFQYPKGLIAEPRLVSELKGMAKAFWTGERWEKDTELLQSLLLKSEPWGELPEQYPQFIFQWRGMVQKKG